MDRFRSILFSPLGDRDNPAAVRRLSEVARRDGATVTLFGAVAEPSRFQRLLHRSDYLDAVIDADTKAIDAKLARCCPPGDDLTVDYVTTTGDPALRIIESVITDGHDLVVVTTDDDETDHATINRLMRKCPCPVWVIRPTRARVPRVLAAINPDPDEADLNQTITELATSMVGLHGGELHLVHAWELYGEATLRQSAFVHSSDEEVDELVATEKASRRQALDAFLTGAGLADQPWKIHLPKGPASTVVPELVRTQRINLLVMGTVARTGVSGLVIGNTAETVLDHVRCSVIAVKPPGFVSPVRPGG